jgi:hypothetical protein
VSRKASDDDRFEREWLLLKRDFAKRQLQLAFAGVTERHFADTTDRGKLPRYSYAVGYGAAFRVRVRGTSSARMWRSTSTTVSSCPRPTPNDSSVLR